MMIPDTTEANAKVAAQVISDYLLTGMHHATPEARRFIQGVVAMASYRSALGFLPVSPAQMAAACQPTL